MAQVTLGGQEYELSPLTIGDLQDCWGDITGIADQPHAIVQSKLILNVLGYSIAHKHPGATGKVLMDACTMADYPAMNDALSEVLAMSGLKPEGGETGEIPPNPGAGTT